jgi:hypothetical protein
LNKALGFSISQREHAIVINAAPTRRNAMSNQKPTKQTAANNEWLADQKRTWNTKIYKKVSILLNTTGKRSAIDFLQQFTTAKLRYDDDQI